MARKTTRTTKPRATKAPAPAPRPVKSAFRATTWITVLVLAAVIGFAVYLNRKAESPDADATPSSTVSYVFSSEDGLASSIEVKPAEGDAVRLARNADSLWALELPEAAEADQGAAEAAATSVTTLRILNEIDLALADLGLDNPDYIITIKFTGGGEHALEVGDMTPTSSGYYIRLDGEKSLIVSRDGIDGLLTLLMFPPYLSTPTPTATPLPPTETPVPATETAVPEVSVTPTP